MTKELRERVRRPLNRLRNGREDWFRLQMKSADTPVTSLYIFDEIGYWGDSAKNLVDVLSKVEGNELAVHINSPGGDIFDGLAIYQALKDHPANVTVHVDGLAASIASVIAMAGDKVIMAPKASMMIHDGWTMSVGNAADLRKTADLLDKQSSIIASVYADKGALTAEEYRSLMEEETWLDAQEALALGLVDEIEGQKPAKTEAFDLSVFQYAGRSAAPPPKTSRTSDGPETTPAAPEGEPGTLPVASAETPEPETPEPAPFAWDFSVFQAALKEGTRA